MNATRTLRGTPMRINKCTCEGAQEHGQALQALGKDKHGTWYNCMHCGTTKLMLNEQTRRWLDERKSEESTSENNRDDLPSE